MVLDRQAAKNLGELIGRRIAEEHPDLVKRLRTDMDAIIKKHHKPWYTRFYERAKCLFYN